MGTLRGGFMGTWGGWRGPWWHRMAQGGQMRRGCGGMLRYPGHEEEDDQTLGLGANKDVTPGDGRAVSIPQNLFSPPKSTLLQEGLPPYDLARSFLSSLLNYPSTGEKTTFLPFVLVLIPHLCLNDLMLQKTKKKRKENHNN